MNNKIIALDLETTGLDPWKDEILMVGLHDGMTYTCLRSKEELQGMLMLVNNVGDGVSDLVCHNAQFDIKFLEVKGWWKPDGRVLHDTKIMASLLPHKVPKSFIVQYEQDRKALNKEDKTRKLRQASPTSLKVIAPYYLQVPRFWESGNFNDEEYNKKDCQYTHELCQKFECDLDDDALKFYFRMLDWSDMIRVMEMKGIMLSEQRMQETEQEYKVKHDTLTAMLHNQWQEYTEEYRALRATEKNKPLEKIPPFNFASPKQMTWLLKNRLGLDISTVEDPNEDSTDKAVLNRLAAEGREDIQTFLDWRQTRKILTAYLPSYRKFAHENTIHTSFSLTDTRTGRTACSKPNLQQVPDTIYKVFTPRVGCKFVKNDLSGIEAALIACYSGDRAIFDILARGESIHDHNTKILFGLSCDVCEVADRYPRERKCVKTIGFACFYGAGAKRIKNTFAARGFPITTAQAKQKLKLLKDHYKRAFEFHKEITEVFASGQTVLNLLGRPVNIQPWENPYMQGFNRLIQSSASDLNLEACYRYWKGGGTPLLVIHDCILAEEPKEKAEEMNKLMVDCMTNWQLECEHGSIELRVEGGVSDVWEA